jgi:hypothetical protein
MTALAVMAMVNLCNFSEDMKDIFMQRNGINVVKGLLNSKHEDIVLNGLRLTMTLISKKEGETNTIGR